MIVAEDEVQTVKSEPGLETNIRVFADTDAIRALRCISRDRPRVVVLGRAFVGSPRGAALVNAIKTDRTLANKQIRVISRASDYVGLVRCSGFVVWVSFEPRGKSAPRYRAGVQFIDADPKAIADLVLRHLQH